MRLLALLLALGLSTSIVFAEAKKETKTKKSACCSTDGSKCCAATEKKPEAAQEDAKKKEDKLIATVYGVKILDSQVSTKQQALAMNMMRSGRVKPEQMGMIMPMLRQQAITQMINENLLMREVKQKKIKLPAGHIDKVLDGKVQDILKQNSWTMEQFDEQVQKAMGISCKQYVEKLKNDPEFEKATLLEYVIETNYKDSMAISDKDIKDFYDKNPTSFKQDEQVQASHILIKTEGMDDAQKKEARAKIDALMVKAKMPDADFAALAKENSACPSSAKGGDLGMFGHGQMVPEFDKAAFAGKVGQVCPEIVETQFGYHIIKVTGKTESKTVSFEEAKDGISAHLKQTKIGNSVTDFYKKLTDAAGDNVNIIEKPAAPAMPGMAPSKPVTKPAKPATK